MTQVYLHHHHTHFSVHDNCACLVLLEGQWCCWRTRVTHDRQTVFLTNKCQTSEGVDHFRNRQSKAHSFYFSRKLNPHQSSTGVRTTGHEPKCTFRFALAGTNAIGVVRVLCTKSKSHVFFHFALQISISSGEGVGEHACRMTDERSFQRTNARPRRELTILGTDRAKLTLFALVGN